MKLFPQCCYTYTFLVVIISRCYATQNHTLTSIYHFENVLALLEVNINNDLVACKLDSVYEYSEKHKILKTFVESNLDIRKLSFEDMVDLIYRCKDVPSFYMMDFSELIPTDIQTMISLNLGVLPQTLWCGLGQKTLEYSDLGEDRELDKCCRAHDHCPIISRGFSRDNPLPYTVSHCLCDQKFAECLKEVGSNTANIIGRVFFNIIRIRCFELVKNKDCARSLFGICFDNIDKKYPKLEVSSNSYFDG